MQKSNLEYKDIVFDAKPEAVPFNYRISYKVTQLCLIMQLCGRGNICSLIKLHMISYALISKQNMDKLMEFIEKDIEMPIIRFDTSVNRALTYAVAYGLIEQLQTGKYKLTSKGHNIAEKIKQEGDIMVAEICSLNTLSKKLTETMIDKIVEAWRTSGVEN